MANRVGPQSLWELDEDESMAALSKPGVVDGKKGAKSKSANLFDDDDVASSPKGNDKALKQQSKARSILFDSDDEATSAEQTNEKNGKTVKAKQNLFDSDEDIATTTTSKAAKVPALETKNKPVTVHTKAGLFDDDDAQNDSINSTSKQSALATANLASTTTTSIASKPSQSNLFDSDSDSDALFTSKQRPATTTRAINTAVNTTTHNTAHSSAAHKPAHSLFDSDSEADMPDTSVVDYRVLYVQEMHRRQELESAVLALKAEVQALRTRLGECDPVPPRVSGDAGSATDKANYSLSNEQPQNSHHGSQQPQQQSAEWEALAREEKLRRQKARSSGGAHRGSRAAGAGKRLHVAAAGQGSAVMSVTDPKHGNESDFQTAQPESSNFVLRSNVVSPLPPSDDMPATSHSGASAVTAVDTRSTGIAADTPCSAEEAASEDPETAKWRELALQEKQRKAMARRSVRAAVRRPPASSSSSSGGPAGSNPAGAGGSAATATTSVSGAQSAATGMPTNVSNTNLTGKAQQGSDPDSDWDSQSSDGNHSDSADGDEGCLDEGAKYTNVNVNNSHTSNSQSAGTAHSYHNGGNRVSVEIAGLITAEQEAALDLRMKRWASGKPVWLLLHTVPQQAAKFQYTACTLLLEGGVVQAAVQGLGEHSEAGDVRKAYM